MTQEEIITGNKLIAQFMNYNDVYCPTCKYYYDCDRLQCGLTKKEKKLFLGYDQSWDRLMSVVEKITTEIGIKSIEECDETEWYVSTNLTRLPITTPLPRVYQAVIEFIKWYNKTK